MPRWWKGRPGLDVMAALILAGLLLGGSARAGAGSPPDPTTRSKPGAANGLTLEQYRELREAAEAAWGTPQMDKRVARCEAFLREHPDYPNLRWVRKALIDACLETKSCPPGRIHALLKEQAEALAHEENGAFWIQLMVQQTYLKHDLPLDGAEQILDRARATIEEDRRKLAGEKDERRSREARERLDSVECNLALTEGRVLLARGDAAGAMVRLKQAEAAMRRQGLAGVMLTDGEGGTVASLPQGTPIEDWLYLSLADAAARQGDRAAARRYLERVRLYTRSYAEQAALGARLRRELAMPAPPTREFRSDPVPAPAVTFHDLKGKPVSLARYRGQVVLLMLWTTW